MVKIVENHPKSWKIMIFEIIANRMLDCSCGAVHNYFTAIVHNGRPGAAPLGLKPPTRVWVAPWGTAGNGKGLQQERGAQPTSNTFLTESTLKTLYFVRS